MKNGFLVVFCIVLSACSQVSVQRDYDNHYDFSRVQLYTLEKQTVHSENARKVENDLLERRLATAIRSTLGTKGFSEVTSGGNVIVRYGHYLQTVVQSAPVTTSVGYGLGRRGSYGGIGVNSGYTVEQYDKSLVVIDVIDSITGNLVWRGKGSRRALNASDDPQKSEQAVGEAVSEVLKNFPPQIM